MRGKNAVNPFGFASILTKDSEKFFFQNLIRVPMVWFTNKSIKLNGNAQKNVRCRLVLFKIAISHGGSKFSRYNFIAAVRVNQK